MRSKKASQEGKKVNEEKKFGFDDEKRFESFDENKIAEQSLHRDDERVTPLNMKSIYNKEYPNDNELPLKSPSKLPYITKRTNQPSPTVHTPTPIPILPSADLKRFLKQAVSRRKNE